MSESYGSDICYVTNPVTKLGFYCLVRLMCGGGTPLFNEQQWIEVCTKEHIRFDGSYWYDSGKGDIRLKLTITDEDSGLHSSIVLYGYTHRLSHEPMKWCDKDSNRKDHSDDIMDYFRDILPTELYDKIKQFRSKDVDTSNIKNYAESKFSKFFIVNENDGKFCYGSLYEEYTYPQKEIATEICKLDIFPYLIHLILRSCDYAWNGC